jgi:DNA-directed RNA polymerase specialized sigma24 family protein
MARADVSARSRSPEITGLLVAWGRGEESALAQLTPLVHRELRRLARSYLRRERDGHTLQTDALVNEAYLHLIDLSRVEWRDRTHFFALAARLMRRILVDYARARQYQKRGGGAHECHSRICPMSPLLVAPISSLSMTLSHARHRRSAKGTGGRAPFFWRSDAGEIAETIDVSEQTVLRDWRMAKMWLLRELSGAGTR